MGLVSMRELARVRGVSLTAVQKALKSGRIHTTPGPDGKPKIDLEAAMAQWDANTEQAKRRTAPDKAPATAPQAPTTGTNPPTPPPKVPGASSTYADSRAIREAYLARIARLTYEERVGKMVESDRVKLEAFQAARLTRDTLLNLPNKISHELAAEVDPDKVHNLLTRAINGVLDELAAEGVRRMEQKEAQLGQGNTG